MPSTSIHRVCVLTKHHAKWIYEMLSALHIWGDLPISLMYISFMDTWELTVSFLLFLSWGDLSVPKHCVSMEFIPIRLCNVAFYCVCISHSRRFSQRSSNLLYLDSNFIYNGSFMAFPNLMLPTSIPSSCPRNGTILFSWLWAWTGLYPLPHAWQRP
jgi:hypothetical protein